MNKFSLFLLALSSLIYSNEISFYEVKDSDDQSTEISFLLDKVSFIKSYSLVDPSRIVIDVYQSDLKSDVQKKYNYPIKQIRASSKDDLTRIVIDLYEYVNWNKPTQEKTDEGILLKIKVKKNKDLKNNIRDIIVAIDAGHGGEDPGAVGAKGTKEKVVNLQISQRIKRLIDKEPFMKAVLIRTGDYFIPLGKRVSKARKIKADIFISIHADAFKKRAVRGSSVFALSERGATSAFAKFLAGSIPRTFLYPISKKGFRATPSLLPISIM